MVRYGTRLNYTKRTPLILLLIIFCVAVFAMVDWYVLVGYYNFGGSADTALYNYWKWGFLFFMTVFTTIAVAFWAGAPKTQVTYYIMVGIILTGFILIFGGFEDYMFFALNQGLPPNEVQWAWMFQYRLFKQWNTRMHLMWMGFWLLVVLPVMWAFIFKISQKYRISVMVRRSR